MYLLGRTKHFVFGSLTLFMTISSAHAGQPLVPWLSANGQYGFADEHGEVVIPPRFERAGMFSEGRAAAAVGGAGAI